MNSIIAIDKKTYNHTFGSELNLTFILNNYLNEKKKIKENNTNIMKKKNNLFLRLFCIPKN